MMLDASGDVVYQDANGDPIEFFEFAKYMAFGYGFEKGESVDGATTRITFTLQAELPRDLTLGAKITAGQAFPPYSLVDMEGKLAGHEDLHGRYTLINFFFSECAPCIHEFPDLNNYAASNPDVNVLAVTFDSADDRRALLKKHPLSWRILSDADTLIQTLGIRSYPTFALVDPAGKLAAIVAR